MYAHVTGDVVDHVGHPPRIAFEGGRQWDLRTLDPATLATCSWYPVDEAPRPADTPTTTWDSTWVFSPEGPAVTQVWVERPKTPAEVDAEQALANNASIRAQAAAALEANRTFLALGAPTNAQTLAQVRALTRQNQGLIRIALGALDGTD